jgi:hypothetical protein
MWLSDELVLWFETNNTERATLAIRTPQQLLELPPLKEMPGQRE